MITAWIIVAAVLLVFELLTQCVWALCVAIGCVGGIVAALMGIAPEWQYVTVGIVTVIALFLVMPPIKRWLRRRADAEGISARTGMDALLGRRGIVTHEIKPGGMGRVQIDGDSWQAVAPGTDTVIPRGTEAVVTSYDSIIITVTPLKS